MVRIDVLGAGQELSGQAGDFVFTMISLSALSAWSSLFSNLITATKITFVTLLIITFATKTKKIQHTDNSSLNQANQNWLYMIYLFDPSTNCGFNYPPRRGRGKQYAPARNTHPRPLSFPGSTIVLVVNLTTHSSGGYRLRAHIACIRRHAVECISDRKSVV